MDHAVSYADNRTFDKQPARQLDDLARGRAVVEAVRVEAPLLDPSASSVRDLEMRLNADTLDLSLEKAALVIARLVDGKLDARRAGVHHSNGFRHGSSSFDQALRLAPPST